jgi:hypothetical protein
MRDFALILATVGRTVELNRLFDTLAAQSYRDFEVIVVDQNRDDRLLPVLHRARYLGHVTQGSLLPMRAGLVFRTTIAGINHKHLHVSRCAVDGLIIRTESSRAG